MPCTDYCDLYLLSYTSDLFVQVMKKREVEEMDDCKYIEVNDQGLVIERGAGKRSTLEVSVIFY